MKAKEIKEIKVGSDILYDGAVYGKLMSITPKGMYSIKWDMDEWGQPRTYFTKEQFYNSCIKIED